jgi:hypothetical protein
LRYPSGNQPNTLSNLTELRFSSLLYPTLRPAGVELADFSFNKDAANIGETYLNVAVKKLNSAIRIGLDQITYIAVNPD